MPKWIRDIGGRLIKCDTPQKGEFEVILNIMEAAPEDQHSHQGRQDNLNEFRSMRDRMHPPRMSAPSCIVPPTEQLVIRPYLVPLLPTFHGMESENPYAHIKEFEDVCNTFQEGGASIDLMRLKLFPFTLKDKAKIWLNSLRPRTKENEKFYECWERYMEAINACPHHGFDTWLLVSYFYDGMSSSMKQLLETMCGGDFMSKNPEEAMDFLSYVADVSRGWDEPTKGEVGKMKSQLNAYNAKAGMYILKEDDDMKAKLAAMTRRLEELELKRMHEVQAVAEAPVQVKLCPNCQSFEHLVEECPAISAEREMYRDQANVVGQFRPNNNAPYGNTYNSSWKNHPNFSWKARATQYQQPDPPSQQSSSIEQIIANLSKVVGDFVGKQEATNAQAYKFEYTARKRKISFSPNQNPKGVHEVESHEGESSQVKDVKALITLRSGKKIEHPTPKPHVEKEEEMKKGKEMEDKESEISEEKKDSDATMKVIPEKELLKEEMLKKSTFPPFPQALQGKKGVRNAAEILEVLRQVKVNIPLLDMIKQVPTYAKFLKDLCTIKRGLTVNKKAFLTEQKSIPWRFRFTGGGSSCKRHSSGQMVHFLALEIQLIVNSLTGDVQRLLQLDFTLILSLIQLAMVHASHEHLPFKVIFNLGLPFTNSQEITNGCLLGVQKLTKCWSILGFRQQKSNGKISPNVGSKLREASGAISQEKSGSAKFRRHPRGLRNYFARPSYLHQAAKLASILKFLASLSRHGSCIVRRRNTLLYKSVAKFSQQKVDSAALQSDWLVMAATSSFQLQIGAPFEALDC
ncbi:hypothetical protein CK203_115820 [Vitis vinifera]|uniref:Retrotransposon gag domain-containing protein n=1 Tax=Vitis vinifera TaxID=29760 RepID=A0A438DFU9_VITVI|nr:hypothetical protein CK203_115820 [Vitis vinifera]